MISVGEIHAFPIHTNVTVHYGMNYKQYLVGQILSNPELTKNFIRPNEMPNFKDCASRAIEIANETIKQLDQEITNKSK